MNEQSTNRVYVIGPSFVCSPDRSCLTSAQDRARIDAFLRRSRRYRYCADSVPLITDIFAEADQSLFRRILNNEFHVLHQLLPEKTNCTYNLRSLQHDRQLTRKSTDINDSVFYPRDAMLARVIAIATCPSVCLSRAGIVSKRRKLAA